MTRWVILGSSQIAGEARGMEHGAGSMIFAAGNKVLQIRSLS